ncbi:histidine phosphatase family protein [Paracidobacterium acidisoli]|uniref:Histidine phosphatase family protein n=1 Tax=Paracidobacterium acidisoli TaxID=2303751 RepID=A0A372IPQ4_9BACT|nr:histidine phosphatase family protein [Paracidobacterium acidisoli]MBT9331252.1 histidine phosphatase family protein [Paracidobacterium acidisoli]
MSRIVFIRHTATDMAGRFCGHSDPDLNATGEEQLRHLLDEIAPLGIERIFSSDLLRARRVAEAIASHYEAELYFRSTLREISFGEWESMEWSEIQSRFPEQAQRWLIGFPLEAAPGGESYESFTTRVALELQTIVCEQDKSVTAIVTHRGVMQFALARFFSIPAAETWQRTARYGAVVSVEFDEALCALTQEITR